MGGGGPSSTQSTVTQSNLPAYAQPYYQALMDRGMKESQQPYEAYGGQRLAGMSDSTQAGLNATSAYANSGTGLLDKAANTQDQVSQGALNASNYQSNAINAQNIGTQNFDSNAAQQYMSPYMDAVVNKAQADAMKNAQIEQQQRNLNAAKAGSFGGSRAAVQNQMATGQLQSNLTDIYTQGRQSAFENAQSQFNADQGRSLTAAQANQGANLDAAKATEQYRQSGAQLGLQGLDLANTSAQNQAKLQSQYDQTALQKAQAQLGVGQTREDYQQQNLDQNYQDFVNQRDSEKQNLQFLSSLLQGVPVSANSDVTNTATGSQNNVQGLLGSMGGLQALYALGKT